ncbi:MAG: GDSL family lipase, partial [Oscillospiraceae bacterium]
MKLIRLTTVICAALTALAVLGGCSAGNIGEESEVFSENNEVLSEDKEVLSEKSFAADNMHVKPIGRTLMSDGTLWIAHSASGVEFSFSGTSASITLVGDGAALGAEDTRARFAVYVNGEKTLDELVDSAEKTYEIFSSESATETTVKLLKLSESANSTFGIKSIDVTAVDGIAPTAEKELKIEFIGDSITCGYGVDDEVKEHHFSTATEDATRAYAYKTAQLLDADYSLVSYSGHGIISGYTDNGKKSVSQLVPKVYEQFAKTYGSSQGFFAEETEW